jgi:photosystem II stability/assembly factor-like uncharacterized protein
MRAVRSAALSKSIALAVNPLTPSTVYALLVLLFQVVPPSELLSSVDLTAIAVDSSGPMSLYLGTSAGIRKTTDGGGHWTQSISGLKAVSVGPIWASSGVVLAANATLSPGSTVFRTADGGRTWSVVVGLRMRITQLEADPQDASTIYASSEGDILIATNEGVNWGYSAPDGWGPPQSFGTGSISSNDSPLAIDPRNGSTMYRGATYCNPYGTCDTRIYKSLDSGLTWTTGSPLNGKSCCSYVSQIVVDTQDSSVVYAGAADDNQTGSGLWKSVDGGATWTNLGGRYHRLGDPSARPEHGLHGLELLPVPDQ